MAPAIGLSCQGTIWDLCKNCHEKLKDWNQVEQDMLRRYGSRKRTTVRRWIAMTRFTPEAIIAAASGKFPLTVIMGNPYFVSEGSNQKLSSEFGLCALSLFEKKPGASGSTFQLLAIQT